ncbi:HAD-IA family hydrolase [Agromyces aerolatus]|uniref:HAD-IA family hydrolase n=1 Tax=Agromyces sp. LY-1074 TaxID=3074080 RepID=UPI002865FF06|nr:MULTISPECIES: HAD-IA family hydrolase [unclassified Agromyces]MDR5701281.1 HAD-IA family hydrolase [Agromyces sp. LY-1074]MDR5707539.1 HAD-IA family hydrolase [Agromyces sp. LY-1358]
MGTPLFLFDFDQTLSAYDFRKRLPALALATGVSQYRLASSWWAAGHEAAAEEGAYATSEEYLTAFREVTGGALTRRQWIDARLAAMTPVPETLEAVRLAGALGTASLLSNNPIIFRDCFPELAPEAAALLGGNDLVSAILGARKPDRRIFERALAHYGADAADAMFVDDSAANVAGARAAGLTAFQIRLGGTDANARELVPAIRAFAADRGHPLVE